MATKKEQTEAKNNVITLRNKRNITIKPTKLKYFANGDYAYWRAIEEKGLDVVLSFYDGRQVALQFLSAVLDKGYEVTQVETENELGESIYVTQYRFDEELEKMFDEELSLQEFNKIIEVSKEVNGISGKN